MLGREMQVKRAHICVCLSLEMHAAHACIYYFIFFYSYFSYLFFSSMQTHYEHALLKDNCGVDIGPRVNITFRVIHEKLEVPAAANT